MMAESGAKVDQVKIQAVIDYLKAEFPGCEINHVPKGDQIADLFQIIRSSEAVHRLLVRRKFFDDHRWPNALSDVRAAERMRKAGAEIVDLA